MTLLIRDDLKCRFAYDAQNFQDEEGHGLLSELQFLFFSVLMPSHSANTCCRNCFVPAPKNLLFWMIQP